MGSRRWAFVVIAATTAAAAASACGLDAIGRVGPETEAGLDAAPGADASGILVESDASPPSDDLDGGSQVVFDPDAACGTVTVEDPLTGIDDANWQVEKNDHAGDAPRAAQVVFGPRVVLLVDDDDSARGGIWLKTPVAFRSMDVSVKFGVGCPWYASSCADGLVIAWLDTKTTAGFATAPTGSAFGIPAGVRGGAAVVDIYPNGGESAPAVRLLSIDGAKAPGSYPWAIASSDPDDDLVGPLRALDLHVHGGVARVSIDGDEVVSGPVPSDFTGLFGLSAATGGASAQFVVYDLKARFSACDP